MSYQVVSLLDLSAMIKKESDKKEPVYALAKIPEQWINPSILGSQGRWFSDDGYHYRIEPKCNVTIDNIRDVHILKSSYYLQGMNQPPWTFDGQCSLQYSSDTQFIASQHIRKRLNTVLSFETVSNDDQLKTFVANPIAAYLSDKVSGSIFDFILEESI